VVKTQEIFCEFRRRRIAFVKLYCQTLQADPLKLIRDGWIELFGGWWIRLDARCQAVETFKSIGSSARKSFEQHEA
jgi:hypothetical protein